MKDWLEYYRWEVATIAIGIIMFATVVVGFLRG